MSAPPRAALLTGIRTAHHKPRRRADGRLRAAAAELARRVAHLTDLHH